MTTATGLVFDEARHAYTLDGVPVPGVTTALKVCSSADYAGVDPEVMERAAARGTAVHRMIELDGAGRLDEDSLDDQLQPYFSKWRQFLAQSGFVSLVREHRVASRRYGYAGTLDLFGILNDRYALIDAKSVVRVMPTTGPQTAAYEVALREQDPWLVPEGAKVWRYALQLPPTGPWKLVPFTSPSDTRVFLAALTIHNFTSRNAR